MQKIDPQIFTEQMRLLESDLLVYIFGAVSDQEDDWHLTSPSEQWLLEYQETYGEGLAMRGPDGPNCLVLSMITKSHMEGDRVSVYPSVLPMVEAQRAAARQQGCAFWNTFEAIGGAQGAQAWYDHQPRWLWHDLRHPTWLGFQELGTMLYTAVIHAFRDWLE
jgi:hypothetical protein